MVHSKASSQTAEDDMLQLSVIRTEAGDAGEKREWRETIRWKTLLEKAYWPWVMLIRSFLKTGMAYLRQEFLKYDAAAAKLKVTVFV